LYYLVISSSNSFEATLELYQPDLGLHTDICYLIGLNALDVAFATASNQVLQSICNLKFATKSYCNKRGKREFNYDKQVEIDSDSSQLHIKGFVGRRRKWGYQKEIKK